MKYGLLLFSFAALLSWKAVLSAGWFLLLLWPALSLAFISFGYFFLGPMVFGKRSNGEIPFANAVLLLPWLILQHTVWQILIRVSSEDTVDRLTDRILIGRRLRSGELPDEVHVVVDLTCEFSEPAIIRSGNYFSFPVLDATAPTPNKLLSWIKSTQDTTGTVFIHCAQGHGRTGMFAAALLYADGAFPTVEAALRFVQQKRPGVRVSRAQRDCLQQFETLVAARPA